MGNTADEWTYINHVSLNPEILLDTTYQYPNVNSFIGSMECYNDIILQSFHNFWDNVKWSTLLLVPRSIAKCSCEFGTFCEPILNYTKMLIGSRVVEMIWNSFVVHTSLHVLASNWVSRYASCKSPFFDQVGRPSKTLWDWCNVCSAQLYFSIFSYIDLLHIEIYEMKSVVGCRAHSNAVAEDHSRKSYTGVAVRAIFSVRWSGNYWNALAWSQNEKEILLMSTCGIIITAKIYFENCALWTRRNAGTLAALHRLNLIWQRREQLRSINN